MKKSIFILALCALVMCLMASCKNEAPKEESAPVEKPAVEEVYQPKHQSQTIDFKGLATYTYFKAPMATTAKTVTVNYNPKVVYEQPIVIKYTYENGDTYTYVIPKTFGLWKNENGKFRVVVDKQNTVWLQGQTSAGKFHELIFYGAPKNNEKKIKPNSYLGNINYSK
jgi:hypothetical protein